MFALAGLAIRLLLAAVHVPPAVAADASDQASLFSQIVLCTGSGLRIIQLDKDGKPLDPSKAPGTAQSCPICTSLSHAPLALAPAAEVVPLPQLARAIFLTQRRDALVQRRKPLVTRGRDPPLPA